MTVFDEFITAFKAETIPFETYALGFSRKQGEEPLIHISMLEEIPVELKEKLIYYSDVLLGHIGFGGEGESDKAAHLEINGSIIVTCYMIVCTRCKTEITPLLKSDGKMISAINISTDILTY